MSIFSKLFGKKQEAQEKVGGMEDYMTLVRVYFQAAIASNVGITNLAMLPDLRIFKAKLHVPTQNNKVGPGEKQFCKKMMQDMYKTNDVFFAEIDSSIKKNCRKIQDTQPYLIQFQGFTQDLMMLTGNLMKIKLRLPSIFKKTIYAMTEKTVHEIYTKNDYKDAGVVKAVLGVRQYNKRLNFSEKWTTEFIYQVVMLAKKEQRNKDQEESNAKK